MSENRRPILSLRRSRSEDPLPRERLQKVLAYAGLGSRRAIEQRIVRGEVKVNGKVALIGDTVGRGDRVEIDGRFFVVTAEAQRPRILLYKPEGRSARARIRRTQHRLRSACRRRVRVAGSRSEGSMPTPRVS